MRLLKGQRIQDPNDDRSDLFFATRECAKSQATPAELTGDPSTRQSSPCYLFEAGYRELASVCLPLYPNLQASAPQRYLRLLTHLLLRAGGKQ